MDFADASYFDIVANGESVILIAMIDRIVQSSGSSDEKETGTLKVVVLREVTNGKWHGPNKLEVVFTRFRKPAYRLKVGGGWSDVDIKPGRYLLLAVPEISAVDNENTPLAVSAVESLESPDDEYIHSIMKALEIEQTQDLSLQTALLEEGLQEGKHSFLSGYAHYAIGRLQRIPRSRAVELELTILSDKARSADDRYVALTNLELELWKDDTPDDSLNRKIVETAFAALQTSDKDFQKDILLSLYNMLTSGISEEDEGEVRLNSCLARSMELPSKKSLLNVLRELKTDPEIRGEAAWIEQLIDVMADEY